MAHDHAHAAAPEKLPGIRHIIAVASGKGGVGKSTVSVNLALALKAQGARVGLIDADILGPSLPVMLGAPYGEQPPVQGNKLLPVLRHGVQMMSMGMLTAHDTPAILRGPMVTKYIRSFIDEVAWQPLDYMIMDLPPGTGDVQLTLAQTMPLSGAIIVTTPQDVSLNIARRGLRMFEKVSVPILGIVENMSGFSCPHCGEVTDIFRAGGGKAMGEEIGVPYLGRIPLDADIVMGGDHGEPVVLGKPESRAAAAFRELAARLATELSERNDFHLPEFQWDWHNEKGAPLWRDMAPPTHASPIVAVGLRKRDPRTLSIAWQDGAIYDYDVRDLRLACPCAVCVDEVSGKKVLDPNSVRMDVAPKLVHNIGRYALGITWNDGHSTGIHAFERLRREGEQASAAGRVAV
ncbi:MAG: P-loop NTPase [Myxococcota bacterium]